MQNKFVVKKVYNFVVKNMKTISWSDFDHEIATTNLFDHEFFDHEMVLCPAELQKRRPTATTLC